MRHERFILALVLSGAILFGWNYFFLSKEVQQNNANNTAAQTPTPSPQPTSQPTATPTPATAAEAPKVETVPQRRIKVQTPLYDVTLDNQGAVATSWIIKKNRNTAKDLYSASSTKNNPQPLELIPSLPPGLKPEQLIHPFRLATGD